MRNGHRFSTSSRTTWSSSGSIPGGSSGRGSLNSSKSAAENTSISPAPLWRSRSSPWRGARISLQCWKSCFSLPLFWVNRL
ncbi:hypothetical protein D3C81_1831270 [compost metagenome]